MAKKKPSQNQISAEVQQQAEDAIATFNREELKSGKLKYIARFKGQYLYLDREDYGQTGPICRLTYTGEFEKWEFAIFKFSGEAYDPNEWMFPGDEYVDGTIEGTMNARFERVSAVGLP
jgi:hypothetical protein